MEKRLLELIAEIENASYHPTASVAIEPVTRLQSWSVRRVHGNFDGKGDSVHFVGWAGYEGRVCSPIQSWDPESRTGISRSGREYQLVGPPGHDVDADYVWQRWITRNGSPEWEDITGDYVQK